MSKFDSITVPADSTSSIRQQNKLLMAQLEEMRAHGAALAERSEALHAQGQLMLQQLELNRDQFAINREQLEESRKQTAALEAIAAELQRSNDRKLASRLHGIFNIVERYERQRARAVDYGPTDNPDVGKRDEIKSEYFPATPEGQETLQRLLQRALEPNRTITRWRVTGSPMPTA